MTKNLEKLERDVQAGQDVTAKCVVKKLKRDQGYEFRKNCNKHAASSLVSQASRQDSEILLKVVEELQEGAKALVFRQRLIWLPH